MVLEYIVKLIFSREMKNRISVFLHLFSILVFRKYQWQSFLYTLQKFGLFFFHIVGRVTQRDAMEGKARKMRQKGGQRDLKVWGLDFPLLALHMVEGDHQPENEEAAEAEYNLLYNQQGSQDL